MKVLQLIFNNAARRQSLDWWDLYIVVRDGRINSNVEIMALLKWVPRVLEFEWQL
jgi:hypothetical protein